MSTKIWVAYRLKEGAEFWETCSEIRKRALKNIKKTLAAYYTALVEDWPNKTLDQRKAILDGVRGSKSPEEPLTFMGAHDIVTTRYRAQVTEYSKDFMDLDVSVGIWRSGPHTLMIPYPGSGLFRESLKFMSKMKQLENFHYQNQVDMPEHVTEEEWEHRRKVWEVPLKNWQDHLVIDICTWQGFWEISPAFEMARKKYKETGELDL